MIDHKDDLKQVIALRLAGAAVGAWDLLRAEVTQIPDSQQVTEAYMVAVALLLAYILYVSESAPGRQPYTDADLTKILNAWGADVRRCIEFQRRGAGLVGQITLGKEGNGNAVH